MTKRPTTLQRRPQDDLFGDFNMMPIFVVYTGVKKRRQAAPTLAISPWKTPSGWSSRHARLVQQIGALKSEQLAPNLKCYMGNLAAADSGGE